MSDVRKGSCYAAGMPYSVRSANTGWWRDLAGWEFQHPQASFGPLVPIGGREARNKMNDGAKVWRTPWVRGSRGERGSRPPVPRLAVLGALLVCVAPAVATAAPSPVGAATLPHSLSISLAWQQDLPDAGAPIAQSSPNVATLDGGGPSVVVGDRAGGVYAFHLSDGSGVPGWPANVGAPVDSTPSASPDGSGTDFVYVGSGNAARPKTGGYVGLTNTGARIWSRPATDPNGNYGVQASLAVGSLEGVQSVVAPSLGQNAYALDAGNGAVLPGWPFFAADSGFTTPSLADLYGNGQTEVVQGGDSTAGLAGGQQYINGGHLRVIGAGGNLLCHYDTNQTVDSSTAVGNFLGGGATGIAFGTGSYFPGAPDSNTLFASDSHCNIVWRDNLGGNTISSPAIGDVLGNGSEQVVEGVDTGSGGSVWALNGSSGGALPGWPVSTPGRIIGGVTLADLTGGGYNDVLAPTTSGLEIFDGKSAQQVATLGAGDLALQNSALVTVDPSGSIGITIAGYGANNEGIIQHYVVADSSGHQLGLRSWPMFHQNPQVTGWLASAAPGHLNSPIVGMASTPTGRGYWNVAADGGLFAFGDAGFHGSMGGHPLARPVVGMASTTDGGGYWEVAADGGLFAFGDAGFFGSMGGQPLALPVVGIAATPDGGGYWEVAADGGLFAFGDAGFFGSTGAIHLNRPIVAMTSTSDGKGYWLVAADGGIFAFGDARYFGSMGAQPLNQPIASVAANGSQGYWITAADGGVFSFGTAPFRGSMGGLPLVLPIVGLASAPSGSGYWMVAADGGIFAFGDAGFFGSMPQVLAPPTGPD